MSELRLIGQEISVLYAEMDKLMDDGSLHPEMGFDHMIADAATAKAVRWCYHLMRDRSGLTSKEFLVKYGLEWCEEELSYDTLERLALAEGVEVRDG